MLDIELCKFIYKDKDKDKDAFIGPKEFVLHIDNGKQQSDKLRHWLK